MPHPSHMNIIVFIHGKDIHNGNSSKMGSLSVVISHGLPLRAQERVSLLAFGVGETHFLQGEAACPCGTHCVLSLHTPLNCNIQPETSPTVLLGVPKSAETNTLAVGCPRKADLHHETMYGAFLGLSQVWIQGGSRASTGWGSTRYHLGATTLCAGSAMGYKAALQALFIVL